jgi:hypothetical protein
MAEQHPNQRKLYRFHLWLAGFYGVLWVLFAFFAAGDVRGGFIIEIFIVMAIPVTLHLVLAFGSRAGNETSRKASVVVGVLMLLGFPIGTLLAFSFLPLTQWKDAAEETAADTP